jgi:hypothetical protein
MYSTIRSFRDGTRLVQVDGRFSIVSMELSTALEEKHMPAVNAIEKVARDMPHLKLSYDGDFVWVDGRFADVPEGSNEDTVLSILYELIADVEMPRIGDREYFIKNYITCKRIQK